MKFTQPQVLLKSFTCPHCNVVSKQNWKVLNWFGNTSQNELENVISIGSCDNCQKRTLWLKENRLFPDTGNTPPPNPSMPDAVKKIYFEAGSISLKSPRGAAALLRLAVQILVKELGEVGKNINEDIASLVKKGLPTLVQQSLDIVRVIGNDAVHPGQIDTDDIETVNKLFGLINIIIEYMINLPKQVNALYQELPTEKLDGIKSRDKKN